MYQSYKTVFDTNTVSFDTLKLYKFLESFFAQITSCCFFFPRTFLSSLSLQISFLYFFKFLPFDLLFQEFALGSDETSAGYDLKTWCSLWVEEDSKQTLHSDSFIRVLLEMKWGWKRVKEQGDDGDHYKVIQSNEIKWEVSTALHSNIHLITGECERGVREGEKEGR